MSCTWHDHEQGSDEWLQARCGLLTASHAVEMCAVLKNGGEATTRYNLKLEIVAERLTGRPAHSFVNPAMRWGIENEPTARQAYCDFTGNAVELCGLVVSNTVVGLGASPDGLVGSDGLVEIKCPNSSTFLRWVLDGDVPEQHKPQMLVQLAVTGRTWCDFVAFDPRFPAEQDLFIRRFAPSPAEIRVIKDAAQKFLDEVAAMERMFRKVRMV